VTGAPPLNVLCGEVGLKLLESDGVGGPTQRVRHLALEADLNHSGSFQTGESTGPQPNTGGLVLHVSTTSCDVKSRGAFHPRNDRGPKGATGRFGIHNSNCHDLSVAEGTHAGDRRRTLPDKARVSPRSIR
jgi:hypothetical protein